MSLEKLAFAAGIYADGSDYSASGRWVDGDKVRFRLSQPEKIGGWRKLTDVTFKGTARVLYTWTDLAGNRLLGIGTNLKLYLFVGDSIYDITPIRATSVINTNAFSTTIGSPVVTITDTAHGAVVGDTVYFTGSTATGGFTAAQLDGEHQIENITDGNTYTIRLLTNATSSATGGGAAIIGTYEMNTGLDTSVGGPGWGAGGWGGVTGPTHTAWGDAAALTVQGSSLRLWSLDSFGEDLVANPRDGAIYYWINASGFNARAVLLSSLPGAVAVPSKARQVMISDSDRKLIAFGCSTLDTDIQDVLLIRWSDSEAPADMYPTEINAAGGFRIPRGAEFISAIETKAEILVWSDTTLHSMRYIGAPLQYGIVPIGSTTIAGPNAAISTNDMVMWMGQGNFFVYNGSIQPLPCPVQDYVFNDFNYLQTEKVTTGTNLTFGEVWWWYCSADSEECNRYVTYNYVLQAWSFGTMARTAWMDKGIFDNPLGTGTDGSLYNHELGNDDGSTEPPLPIEAFITSAPIEIGSGDRYGFISRLIPDLTFRNSSGTPSVDFVLTGEDQPGSGEATNQNDQNSTTVTIPITRFTPMTWPRLRARALTLKIRSTMVGVAWRLGVPRIDVRPDGRR